MGVFVCVCMHVSEMTTDTEAMRGTHLLITQQGTHMESKQQRREKENRGDEGVSATKQQ